MKEGEVIARHGISWIPAFEGMTRCGNAVFFEGRAMVAHPEESSEG